MSKRKLIKLVLRFSPVAIGLIYYVFISYIYYNRIASFLFFDEYANIIAAYFMGKGRVLYEQNFFNHQMLQPYLSFVIQAVLKPHVLFQLISYHRIFIILSSFLLGMLLVLRMRWVGLGFVILYEAVKYYYFGNLFLAESIIIYCNIYLFYLAWQTLQEKSLLPGELLIAGVTAWFVIFNREPYVPLALLLYGVILLQRKPHFKKEKLFSVLLFSGLTLILLATVPLKEYLYQLFYVNYVTVFHDQLTRNSASGLGFPAMVFYPIYVFLLGEQTLMRNVLQLLSTVFLATFAYHCFKRRSIKTTLLIVTGLTLANVRVLKPGVEFYGAFYQIQWFGILATAIFLMLQEIFLHKKKFAIILLLILGIGFSLLTLFNKQYFLWEKQDQQHLFTYNYDTFYITGQAIKIMATPESKLFVDLSDSLVFWTADIPSAYPYGVYYPVADDLPNYRSIRTTMFQQNPPDFYYTNCLEGRKYFTSLPQSIQEQYAPIKFTGSPTCFYARKALVSHLSEKQLNDLASLRFSIAQEYLTQRKDELVQ